MTMDDELFPISKAEAAKYIETVHGIIIGNHTITARLYSKKTRREVAHNHNLENDAAASGWAREWVRKQKEMQGVEYARIYGDDGFELRVWG